MIFQQFEAKGLSHFSYAVGSKEEAEIAIIDPERDIKTYITFAAENRVKISYILETHIHADYASGARALAERTGAKLFVSAYDTNQKYAYNFPHNDIKEGEKIEIGKTVIEALHTPGHTPEHISFLVYDKERSADQPVSMLSGDFLFVGSVGRPDLLGDGDKLPLAKQLYNSIQTKLKNLPDSLEIYPGHGAGSLCGAGMSDAQHTTLGLEREANPYLQQLTEQEFTDKILGSIPHFPEYYLRMKQLNSDGAPLLESLAKTPALTPEEFAKAIGEKCIVLDVRNPLAFGGGHIDGAINIPSTDQMSFYGPVVLSYYLPIYLVVEDVSKVRDYVQALVRVGIENIQGYLQPNFNSWVNRGNDFTDLPQASVFALQDFMDIGEAISVIDVRSASEWKSGHIKGAKHIYLGDLINSSKSLPKDKEEPVFCLCGGGFRSSIASSVLMKMGYENVYNVFGGMTAWKGAGLPLTDK
ncbi:MAG: MBL fold metallo-hydrolase [Sphingobacteriales bacterium]|nr:MAG: MBL fold metallo-hydrolase [Sphingobacteriales bacterium]